MKYLSYRNCWKRLVDIAGALLLMLLGLPVVLFLTVVSFIAFRGRPFFVQDRVGQHDQIFRLLKFRSMRDGKGLTDDERLTAWGRFLRESSLDELPQLWNILKGEMSFIGPRPLLVEYLPLYSSHHRRRHLLRPGLSGLAQVMGRNQVQWPRRFSLDVFYVERCSFLFDVRIAWLTVLKVFRKEGVYDQANKVMEPFQGYDNY